MANDNSILGKGSQGGFYSHVISTPSNAPAQDTVKPKLSEYMQKREAQQLVKDRNIAARENVLNRNANARGMTREQVQKQQVSDKSKPDQGIDGLNIGSANKRGETKGSCSTGVSNKGESLKDNR